MCDMSDLFECNLSNTSLRRLSLSLENISIKSLILPPSLEQFKLIDSLLDLFVQTVVMGPKLKRVIFGERFNESLNGVKFPDSLEVIQFRRTFDQPVDEVVFPASLREIHFGEAFNQSLDRVVFPPCLEIISFLGDEFNQSLVHCVLPASLKIIRLSIFYDCSLSGFILPPCLERFEMGQTNVPLQFTHIDSLIQLQFPSTIKVIRLPNPLQSSYQEHPALDSYKEWLTRLSRLHPYARIQFSQVDSELVIHNMMEVADQDQDQDEDEDEDGVVELDATAIAEEVSSSIV